MMFCEYINALTEDRRKAVGVERSETSMKNKKLVCGVGNNDIGSIDTQHKTKKSYIAWSTMLTRCYSKKYHDRKPSYIGCFVCDEWLIYSNFDKWFVDNHVEGYHLDKDILVKDNKIYSPSTCCFVPMQINLLLPKNQRKKSQYVNGVFWNRRDKVFHVVVGDGYGSYQRHLGSFHSEQEAYESYKKAKEKQFKNRAEEYKKQITIEVYNALINWEVDTYDEACKRRDELLMIQNVY